MKLFRKPLPPPQIAAVYLILPVCMLFLNAALPQRDPLSFALYFAALSCGLEPLLCGAGYLIASAASLSLAASLSAAAQAAFLSLVFALYRRAGRLPRLERFLFAAAAQLPFLFLFPHAGYALFPFAVLWQKALIAVFLVLLSFLTEGALSALLKRAFRCRLSAGELAEIALLWLFAGMGIVSLLGEICFFFLSLSALLFAVVLFHSTGAIPFAAVLSLPLCAADVTLLPLAEYTAFGCLALLFVPCGKYAAALCLVGAFTAAQYLGGLASSSAATVVFTLLSCAVPAAAVCLVPEKAYARARRTLLFYRDAPLPRVAVNRNRRAVGEQLYEVSALFREIENAFSAEDVPDNSSALLRERLTATLCASCAKRRKCAEANINEALGKLIAVGKAKGRVNLIDLPAELSSRCDNSAGMLFSLNKLLAEYRRYSAEMDAAREGRKLLAEQAHGVSVILRDIALEQSEEYVFSDEEQALSSALSSAGILSSEIFLYGEGSNLTVSMTLQSGTDGKRLVTAASGALGAPLALAEKIPVTADRACFILKRKPVFDAAFGVASRPKEGEQASGDAHSILKIDERRFLVALSDGMGSGENARSVSDKTLSLIESFYKAKMPSATILSTVNRLIALSSEETFSCLDLASVNLDTGCADIIKIGSPVGFLLSDGELRILEGESLPMGMLEAVHPATGSVTMKADDFLIFMSDGVTAAFGSSAELCAYLSALRPLNPQSLAEELLGNALQRYGGKAEDDMTVVTVKLIAA